MLQMIGTAWDIFFEDYLQDVIFFVLFRSDSIPLVGWFVWQVIFILFYSWNKI